MNKKFFLLAIAFYLAINFAMLLFTNVRASTWIQKGNALINGNFLLIDEISDYDQVLTDSSRLSDKRLYTPKPFSEADLPVGLYYSGSASPAQVTINNPANLLKHGVRQYVGDLGSLENIDFWFLDNVTYSRHVDNYTVSYYEGNNYTGNVTRLGDYIEWNARNVSMSDVWNYAEGEDGWWTYNTTNMTNYPFDVQDWKYEWKKLSDLSSITIYKNQKYVVNIRGDIKIGDDFSVDITPNFTIGSMNFDVNEFAWWNSSYTYRRNITVITNENQTYELIDFYIDASGWTNKPYNDSIRLTNGSCGVSGAVEQTSQIWNKTQTSGLMSNFNLMFLHNGTKGTSYTYCMYYDIISRGKKVYTPYTNYSFYNGDGGETNGLNFTLTNGTVLGGVDIIYFYNSSGINVINYSMTCNSSVFSTAESVWSSANVYYNTDAYGFSSKIIISGNDADGYLWANDASQRYYSNCVGWKAYLLSDPDSSLSPIALIWNYTGSSNNASDNKGQSLYNVTIWKMYSTPDMPIVSRRKILLNISQTMISQLSLNNGWKAFHGSRLGHAFTTTATDDVVTFWNGTGYTTICSSGCTFADSSLAWRFVTTASLPAWLAGNRSNNDIWALLSTNISLSQVYADMSSGTNEWGANIAEVGFPHFTNESIAWGGSPPNTYYFPTGLYSIEDVKIFTLDKVQSSDVNKTVQAMWNSSNVSFGATEQKVQVVVSIVTPTNQSYLVSWNLPNNFNFNFTVYGNSSTFNVTSYLDGVLVYNNPSFSNNTYYSANYSVNTGVHNFTVWANGTDYDLQQTIFTLRNMHEWGRCKNITINNTLNSNALTNYQVLINVSYDTDMNANFSDIAFSNQSCGNDGILLDYWMEQKVDSNFAKTWVEVDSIPASSIKIISMYYKNVNATSLSNGDNTFLIFDDFNDNSFNTSKWETYCTPTTSTWCNFTEANGYINMSSMGDNAVQSIHSKYNEVNNNSRIIIQYVMRSVGHGTASHWSYYGWCRNNKGEQSIGGEQYQCYEFYYPDGSIYYASNAGWGSLGTGATGGSWWLMNVTLGNGSMNMSSNASITDTNRVYNQNLPSIHNVTFDNTMAYGTPDWKEVHVDYVRAWKEEKIQPTYTLGDEIEGNAPIWTNQNQSYNTMSRSQSNILSTFWVDDTGMKYGWLSTNETGAWQNKTVYGSPINLSSNWWNSSYPYRYKIISNSTTVYLLSVNDTFGINTKPIWAYIDNTSIYLYCQNSGCGSGLIAIGNDTAQNNWENESSMTGNNPTLVFQNYKIVAHMGNNVLDSSPSGNNGTNAGNPTYNSTGLFDSSWLGDGTGDYINFGNSASLDCNGNFTATVWVKPHGWGGGNDYIFDKLTPSTANAWQIRLMEDSGNLKASIKGDGSANSPSITTTGLTNNQWTFISFVRDTSLGKIILYVNGVHVGNATDNTVGSITNAGNLYVGTDWSASPSISWDGEIDEVRWGCQALSSTEIQNMYQNGINNMTRLGSIEQRGIWSNFTWQNSSAPIGAIAWRIYANDTYGNENVTDIMTFLLTNSPPTINAIYCYRNGTEWVNCSQMTAFNSNITQVKVNCTDSDGDNIVRTNISLFDMYDNNARFQNQNFTSLDSGWYIYDNTDQTVDDSGQWNITATCSDSSNTSTPLSVNWNVAWGYLEVTLDNPSAYTMIQQNKTFVMNGTVTCRNAECVSEGESLYLWADPTGEIYAIKSLAEPIQTETQKITKIDILKSIGRLIGYEIEIKKIQK